MKDDYFDLETIMKLSLEEVDKELTCLLHGKNRTIKIYGYV